MFPNGGIRNTERASTHVPGNGLPVSYGRLKVNGVAGADTFELEGASIFDDQFALKLLWKAEISDLMAVLAADFVEGAVR